MIDHFSGEYRFLSNFWPARVELDGMTFPTVEHAYVAAKTTSIAKRESVACISHAGKVKRFGRTLVLREDWEEVKLGVMTDLVRQKFKHPDLAQLLKNTREHDLIEGNTWGDTYWGVCKGVGTNHLGRILMMVRGELP